MPDFGPETIETRVAGAPPPDPGVAAEAITKFEAEHADALTDANHVGHRSAIRERSRMYAAAFGDSAATGLDVGSNGVVEPGDVPAAIGAVLTRYGASGEAAEAFAQDLAACGLSGADVAGIVQEVASSSPMADHELVARVGRGDLRDAAAYLRDREQLDELLAEHDLHRYPCVLRECARRYREGA